MMISAHFVKCKPTEPDILEESMKRLVSEFHALDIKALAKARLLAPYSQFDRVWRVSQDTPQVSAAITVLNDVLQLVFSMGSVRVRQDICLTYSSGLRGGKRPWFTCPTCQRRVGLLYHAPSLPFRCRTCCDLVYPSQYKPRIQDYGRRVAGRGRGRNGFIAECAKETLWFR